MDENGNTAGTFGHKSDAIYYGRQTFPEKDWKIINRLTGDVVYCYSEEAERARAEERARAAEAQRLREIQRERSRQQRLRGFNFVGQRPSVLGDFYYDDGIAIIHDDDCVNWKFEGF